MATRRTQPRWGVFGQKYGSFAGRGVAIEVSSGIRPPAIGRGKWVGKGAHGVQVAHVSNGIRATERV